jgi:coniferyl-aldehyde dehydrogenase
MNEHTVSRSVLDQRFEPVKQRFWSMHEASRTGSSPTAQDRKVLLRRLRDMIITRQAEFCQAINGDFGGRSFDETRMTEVIPTLNLIGDALAQLKRWMRPERRPGSILFWPASNRVYWQPKGVVLIISPWNYPLQLSVGPLVSAIAAGNRAIIKPSEATPATSELLQQSLETALGPEWVTVATGDADVAKALSELPFDHILFTGSTEVGKLVMRAAAQHLTPVTLELGGKSPAIVHPDFDHAKAAGRIMRGKLLNAGQTCIAPDYVLVERGRVDAFVRLAREAAARMYPRILDNHDYGAIINSKHFERLSRMQAEARAGGTRVEVLAPEGNSERAEHDALRKMAPALVVDPAPELELMREEIFGPILPIVPYDTLDDALTFINRRPRPLAFYYFDSDSHRVAAVLERTVAGGVSLNDTIYHVAQEGLPFGGIGPSGMGAYHGRDGFRTFSHGKGVFRQGRWTFTDMLLPPYDKRFRRLLDLAIRRSAGWLSPPGHKK